MGAVGKAPTWRDYPRPTASYYEERFPFLSQGDIFLEVPYVLLGPVIHVIQEDVPGPHALLPLASFPVMLVTPTCDFRRPGAEDLLRDRGLNPYQLEYQLRVARIRPLDDIERATDSLKRDDKLATMRAYDHLRRYMYLPSREGAFGESVVDLGPSWLVHLDVLLGCKRVTQLTEAAARQLHYKLVMYETGSTVDPAGFRPPMD